MKTTSKQVIIGGYADTYPPISLSVCIFCPETETLAWGDHMQVFASLEENKAYLQTRLPFSASFDLIGRDVSVGSRQGFLVFIDGFAKDGVMIHVLKALQMAREEQSPYLPWLMSTVIPYIEAELSADFSKLEQFLLSGALLLFVDGETQAVIIDAREYPVRSISEADTEKVTNGAKDGFVETMIFNAALIRRRVRDRRLTFELKTVGESSKTDVCLAYLEGKADPAFLDTLRKKLADIQIDSLVMAEKSLEELLLPRKWYNPLPQTRYTQRPDIAASYLTEGHVLILVDTSPSVMITPATFFYFTQYAEDYNQIPLIGTYYKTARFMAILAALLVIPLWLLLANHPQWLPPWLDFLGAKEAGALPLLVQFLLLELGFDLLKLSSMHTPTYLGGTFGIIGGLLLGDFAVQVGFFVPETIFYMAVTVVASYCIPNSDLTYAIRVLRLVLLLATGLLGLWGLIVGILLILALFLSTKTLDRKRPYLWPLFPLDAKVLGRMFLRKKVQNGR